MEGVVNFKRILLEQKITKRLKGVNDEFREYAKAWFWTYASSYEG